MRFAAVATLGAAVLACGAAQAQPRTLQDALAEAYSNNPTLQAARAQLRATDEGVPQALAGWRPTVVVSAAAGYGDGTLRTAVRGQVDNTPQQPRHLHRPGHADPAAVPRRRDARQHQPGRQPGVRRSAPG